MTKMYSKQVNASANASLGYLGNVGNNIVIDHVSVQNGSGSGLLVLLLINQ